MYMPNQIIHIHTQDLPITARFIQYENLKHIQLVCHDKRINELDNIQPIAENLYIIPTKSIKKAEEYTRLMKTKPSHITQETQAPIHYV